MDILESLLQPDMLFLACGAGCLGLGAALVQAWRNSPYGSFSLEAASPPRRGHGVSGLRSDPHRPGLVTTPKRRGAAMNEKPRCEINVTPLVDVVLVLLIIFMVVTPMVVERVELPRTARPDEKKAKRSEQVRLVVGYPRGDLWIENDQVEESVLVERLKEIHERSPSKSLVLRRTPGSTSPW